MNGTFGPGALTGLLRQLYAGCKTGELRLRSAGALRTVRFRDGDAVYAHSSLAEEGLGETLVRQGLLTQADLERGYDLAGRADLRLDRALLDLGAVDRQPLERVLAEQVRDVLLAASAGEGEYEFEDGPAGEDDTPPGVSSGDVILEAVRRDRDPDAVRERLGDLHRVLDRSADALLRLQKLTLTPTDGYVLSRVDGTLSANEIVQLTPLPRDEVLRSLLGLVSTGVVEFASPRTPARPARAPDGAAAHERRREILEMHQALQTRNHFEILEAPRGAFEAEIKAAYFRQAKRFHPDAHHHPGLADLREQLEAIFIRLGQAYEVLGNTQTRRSYEAKLPPAAAPPAGPAVAAPAAPAPPVAPREPAERLEDAIRAAERHMSAQQYWDAIQALEGVLDDADGRAGVRVRLLLAKALLKNPHWVRRAEETLLAVVKDDPQRLEAYALLGGIYKSGGLRARAAGMFRKVLELQPEHEGAAAQLAELALAADAEPAPDKGGLLRKLLGRR